ncbi:MAG: 30S ribosomal protein S20 [bacterium]
MARLKTGRHTSSIKEARKSVKRRVINRALKRNAKSELKKFKAAILKKDKEAEKILNTAQGILDKLAKKKIYHRNKANRIKSRMASLLKNA